MKIGESVVVSEPGIGATNTGVIVASFVDHINILSALDNMEPKVAP